MDRLTEHRIVWQMLPLIVAAFAVPAAAQEPWLSRLSARHSVGEGIGYSHSFTSIDWFLPLLPNGETTMWFADFRVIVSNDSEFSSNVGTGWRQYVEKQNRIYGINAWWDTRQVDGFAFNQGGIGVECLGRIFDIEINGYTPNVNDPHQQALMFTGNNLLVRTVNALSGGDFLVGINLPEVLEFHSRILGGGYYFDSSRTPDATGWRGRVETAFRDWLAVVMTVQDDELYGRTATVAMELRRPVEHDSNVVSQSMRHKFLNASGGGSDNAILHRLADPIRRQQQIVLTQRIQLATGLANIPLTFIHVVEGAAGIGTFENSYGTITAAMADALAPTSIVYTPQGGTFNENVTLVAGTQLRSNGPRQTVISQQGQLVLPFSGAGDTLTALPARINGDVNVASGTVLNGFNVVGTVSATGVTTATMDTNRIRQPAAMDALILTDSTDMTLNKFLLDQSGGRGIRIDNSSATISIGTIEMTTDDAIEINNGVAANAVNITDTTITSAPGEGIDANLDGAGDLGLSVQRVSVTSTGNAVSAIEDAASTGNLTVAIANTTASSTAGAGFTVDGSAGAGTSVVSRFESNSVTGAGAGGALFTDLMFDAVPGGAADPLDFRSLPIGSSATRVTTNGLTFDTVIGDVDMGIINIFNQTGAGVFVDMSPSLTLGSQAGSTIDTLTSPALNLTDVTIALVFDSVVSTSSPTEAAVFDTVDGSLAATTTVATDAANPPFSYTNIPLLFAVNFGNTTIDSLQGPTIGNNEIRAGGVAGLPTVAAIYNPVLINFP